MLLPINVIAGNIRLGDYTLKCNSQNFNLTRGGFFDKQTMHTSMHDVVQVKQTKGSLLGGKFKEVTFECTLTNDCIFMATTSYMHFKEIQKALFQHANDTPIDEGFVSNDDFDFSFLPNLWLLIPMVSLFSIITTLICFK